MSVRRFFSLHPVTGSTIRISGDEFHHLKNVNRAKSGEPLEVIDGRGALYFCEVRTMKGNEALVDIVKEEKAEVPPPRVIAAPSLLKQRSMNLMIEKLTEMGVDEIRPVMFQRTDETYSPSRLAKWQKIAVQSLKVNKRLWLTQIHAPVSIDELLESTAGIHTRLLLDIEGGYPSASSMPGPVLAVTGPPGGMTPEERGHFIKNGFTPCKINECVLKSETAAISVAAILHALIETND